MAYSFISFLRQGIANGIRNVPDPSKGGSAVNTGSPRPELDVRVNVKYNNGNTEPLPKKKLELYGPGDVVGIDKSVIIRTEPQHYNTTYEPKHLAFIEFYDEDLPWRFSPSMANEDSRKLTPWLALIVLEENEFTEEPTSTPDSGISKPLPSISLKGNTDRLKVFPSPNNLWAFSHVHINEDVVKKEVSGGAVNDGAVKANIRNVIDIDGDYCYSRVVCPRRLVANKAYHAFVIPSFETGRLAGLGKYSSVKNTPVNKASWGEFEQKEFPYYHRWYFRTGDMGDFEYLVDLLEPRVADTKVGFKEIYVDGIQENGQPKPLYVPGALRVPLDTLEPAKQEELEKYEQWEGNTNPHEWQKNIANKLRIDLSEDEPGVTLPVYGRWHADTEEILYKKDSNELLPEATRQDWIHELNLDPRYRAVAALGTKVVQKNQEEFMDAAWEQFEEIREANRSIKNYQLAIEVNKSFRKDVIENFSNEQLLGFTAPLHKQIRSNAGLSATIFKSIDASPVPNAVRTSLFRKMARPKGRISKVGKNDEHIFADTGKNINAKFKLAKEKQLPAGAISTQQFETMITNYITSHPTFISANTEERNRMSITLRSSLHFDPTVIDRLRAGDASFTYTPVGALFTPLTKKTNAPSAMQQSGAKMANAIVNANEIYELQKEVKPEPKIALDLTGSRNSILAGINAAVNLKTRLVKEYPQLAEFVPSGEGLQSQIMKYPEFDLPMYMPLTDLSHEYFLPNINLIEQNSITFLETNQRFIEAYMMGLNHEMSRELLWRGFPTDQRGSYFRNFWDTVGENYQGINEIHTWNKKLGENSATGNSGLLFLVIRGDLLNKYPNSVITAQKADWGSVNGEGSISAERIIKPGAEEVLPIFEAKIEPDIYFLAFRIVENGKTLTEKDLVGTANPTTTNDDPGWFFIFRERPGEPRFGLDINTTENKRRWSDISWTDTGVTESNILNFDKPITVSADVQASWPPKDSAQLAYILYQPPVLVAIHASRLLTKKM
ncbi:MAG: hypothetical protein WCF67_22385 [Chitinophagaceae bacterium]